MLFSRYIITPWVLITTFASILSYVPVLLHWSITDENLGLRFLDIIHGSFYRNFLIIVMSVCVPISMHVIADLLSFGQSFREDPIARFVLIFSMIFPNFITFMYLGYEINLNILLSSFRLWRILLIIMFFYYLNNFAGHVWDLYITARTALLIIFAEFFQNLIPYLNNHSLVLVVKALSYTLYIFAMINIFKCTNLWFRTISFVVNRLNQEQYRCTVLLIFGQLGFMGAAVIDIIFGVDTVVEMNLTCLIIHTLYTLLIVLCMFNLSSRITKRDYMLQRFIHQMESHHSFRPLVPPMNDEVALNVVEGDHDMNNDNHQSEENMHRDGDELLEDLRTHVQNYHH